MHAIECLVGVEEKVHSVASIEEADENKLDAVGRDRDGAEEVGGEEGALDFEVVALSREEADKFRGASTVVDVCSRDRTVLRRRRIGRHWAKEGGAGVERWGGRGRRVEEEAGGCGSHLDVEEDGNDDC